MPDTILTEIAHLNDFVRDICFENGHKPTMFQHISGETLYDATVNILTSTGETVVADVLLREAIVIYLQTHMAILVSHTMNNREADRIYEIMTRHFFVMHILEFYVPLAVRDARYTKGKVQYTIAVVPPNIWGKHVATEMTKLVHTNSFAVAMPAGVAPFIDDGNEAYAIYCDALACCLINKKLTNSANAIKISD